MDDSTDGAPFETKPVANRKRRVFHVLSRINGWSLVIAGFASLGISAYANAMAGLLISLAVTFHGLLELVLSKKGVTGEAKPATRWMALNQLALAASLSLYFAYQTTTLNEEALIEQLLSSPVYDVLLVYPEALRLQLIDSLPAMAGTFYVVAAVVSWLFCGGTAVYYWSCGK